jgi:hypothetical protein
MPGDIPRELRFLPFRGSDAVASGLLNRWQLEGKTWRRLFPDVYVAADIELNHRLMCEAALLYTGRWPRHNPVAASGLSAAYLMGVNLLPLSGPKVELTSAANIRLRHDGLAAVKSPLVQQDIHTSMGLPHTSPERTVFDLARRLDRVHAVSAVDALLHRRLTTLDKARSYLLGASMFRGRNRVSEVFSLADPLSESPMESELRLVIIDEGLPRPECQVKVFDADGRAIARLDLAYRALRIGIEYEGDHHRDRATFRRDIARVRALQAADWTIVRATATDIYYPDKLLRELWSLIERRRA